MRQSRLTKALTRYFSRTQICSLLIMQEIAHRAARAQIPANPRGGHPHDRGVLGARRGLLYDLRASGLGAPGT